MHHHILTRVFIIFLVIFAVITGMTIYALRTINRSVESSDWVNHSYATIYEFENIVSRLRLGEGLMRTYALTGEASDLAASRETFARLGEHFDTAKALTRDEASTRQALLKIEAQVRERETLAQAVWAARSSGQTEKVRALLAADAGSDAVATIERGLDRLRDQQYELLSARDHVFFVRAQTTRWVVGVGVALNFILLASVGWLLRDDLAARQRAATALAEANALLEGKVQARTAELRTANAKLQAENLERKWTITSQEHQLRYNRLIVNSVNDLVFVLTKAMTVTRINAAVVQLTGREDEVILTAPLTHIVEAARDPVTGLDPLARALLEGREVHHHPVTVLGQAGRRIAGRLTLIPLRDQDKVVGGVAVVQVSFSTDQDKSQPA
ncbi:MAG: CHASE3 domain-containing protein [Opitutae bacterium]|nr:CHASE3 domain-containing protein [Opitutae bacterium]